MQKKIIALAVAGLVSGAAFAQSNVQIWGVADLYYANGESDGNTRATSTKMSGVQGGGLSGSRIGFKGTESLGGDLSALFHFEFGSIDMSVNNSGLQNMRQSFVGLSSKAMGTVALGRQYTPGYNFAFKYDPEAASVFSPYRALAGGNGANLTIEAAGNLGRQNNVMAYVSPDFSGLKAVVAYGFGEQEAAANAGGTDDQKVFGLGIDYDAGPLSVGFVYHNIDDVSGTAVNGVSDDLTEWSLGAKYNLGFMTVYASYQDFEADNATAVGTASRGSNYDGDIMQIGVGVPVMANGTVTLTYAKLDRSSYNRTTRVTTGMDADGWGISYRHALSKRTTAYVGYSSIDNNKNSVVNTSFGQAAPTAGRDSSGWGAGVRHTF